MSAIAFKDVASSATGDRMFLGEFQLTSAYEPLDQTGDPSATGSQVKILQSPSSAI